MVSPVTPAMVEYIAMFLLIIVVVQLLKRRGIFNDSHQPVFDRLVTEFALPAIVFGVLTTTAMRPEWILPVLIVNIAVIVAIIIAWGACRALGLSPSVTGAVIILSGFGSTYTVGVPVIAAAFGLQSDELALGHAIGSFGFALPFFTLGILIAAYHGLREKGEQISLPAFLKSYFISPIFIAFWAGLFVAVLFTAFHLPGADIYYDVFTDFFVAIQHAVALLVWIALGLLLRPVKIRTLVPLLVLVVLIHLIVLPALVFAGGSATGLPLMQRQMTVLLAAMPSGAIAAVIADRYGCDGKIAAAIVIGTYLISLVTLPVTLAIGL
jgi:predicted permease